LNKSTKVYINESLANFKNEVQYVLEFINSRLNTSLSLSEEKESALISYGELSGKISIFQTLFSDYISIKEGSLSLKKSNYPYSKKPYTYNNGIQVTPFFEALNNEYTISNSGSDRIIHFDIFGILFFYLTRIEELDISDMDKHNRFQLKNTLAYKSNVHNRPEVEYYILLLEEELNKLGVETKYSRDFELVPTHDVDRLRSYHSLYKLFREEAGSIYRRRKTPVAAFKEVLKQAFSGEPYTSFNYLMEESEKRDLKSRFFFLCPSDDSHDANYMNDFVNDLNSVVKDVNDRNHMTGIHAGYNTYDSKELLESQISLVRKVTGNKVIQNRQHVLRWNPFTPSIQNSLNIKKDYSLAFPEGICFRSGTTHPYKAYCLKERRTLDLCLVQTPIMEFSLFMDKYVNISRDEAYGLIKDCALHYKRLGGELPILFHTVTVTSMKTEYEKTLDLILNTVNNN